MPIFEYFCAPCQHHWEVIVSTHAADAPGCPLCGVPGRKELSAPAFQFKGSGWYVTDYAKSGAKGGKEGDSGSETKASESKASESKAEGGAKSSEDSKAASPSKADSTAAAPATPNATSKKDSAATASTSTTSKPTAST